jgi:hypothetical protein
MKGGQKGGNNFFHENKILLTYTSIYASYLSN